MFTIIHNITYCIFFMAVAILFSIASQLVAFADHAAILISKLQFLDDGSAELNQQTIARLQAELAETNTRLAQTTQEKQTLTDKWAETNKLQALFRQGMEAVVAAKTAEKDTLEKHYRQLHGKVALIEGRSNLHFKKLQAAVAEAKEYKAKLEKANGIGEDFKAARTALTSTKQRLRSTTQELSSVKEELEAAQNERKTYAASLGELADQRDMYRDELEDTQQKLEAELGSDDRRVAKEAQEAQKKANVARRVAEKKASDLAAKLQLAQVLNTQGREKAGSIIATLRAECAAAEKQRDTYAKELHTLRTSLSTPPRASKAVAKKIGSTTKAEMGRKAVHSATLLTSASVRFALVDKENAPQGN